MHDRRKLLVHFRRLSTVFDNAFTFGPDGTKEGKFKEEHPVFVHHGCAFYLAGCLAYLESEDGTRAWHREGAGANDFDEFVSKFPSPPKRSYLQRGINTSAMDALAEIRNAMVHNDGDLALNRNTSALAVVSGAKLPGVQLVGSCLSLEEAFLGFVRLSCLAVKNYHGDF